MFLARAVCSSGEYLSRVERRAYFAQRPLSYGRRRFGRRCVSAGPHSQRREKCRHKRCRSVFRIFKPIGRLTGSSCMRNVTLSTIYVDLSRRSVREKRVYRPVSESRSKSVCARLGLTRDRDSAGANPQNLAKPIRARFRDLPTGCARGPMLVIHMRTLLFSLTSLEKLVSSRRMA